MTDDTILRTGAVTRLLKMDPELNCKLAKKSVEFINHAACVFVRTLAKSCAVNAARNGKKGRIELEILDTVISTYPQLAFLEGVYGEELDIDS